MVIGFFPVVGFHCGATRSYGGRERSGVFWCTGVVSFSANRAVLQMGAGESHVGVRSPGGVG